MRGLQGHLDLVCALDDTGRSHLRRQSFRAPIHLSKPHLDAGTLVVNVVNPTAGLLDGDRIACTVAVESGAALSLTAPSASRAHRVRDGHSSVTQKFHVAAGAWFENWPELFIPQAGARYRQHTVVEVEAGGRALITESIAPGRVAAGEVLAFAELAWSTDVVAGGVTVLRERYRLAPESEAAAALRRQFAAPYYASCVAIAPEFSRTSPCWETIHALHTRDLWIGCGALGEAGWVVKIAGAGSVAVRRALAVVRAELHGALGRRAPSWRRAG
jgi:urease accessory protein